MLIVISGTPATGKTTVAKILSKMLKANLISINNLVKKKKIKSRYDRKRKTFVVSENDINKVVKKLIKKDKINIVEGHTAHVIKAEKVFILRCSPPKLLKRMGKKKWSKNKIRENVEAEILDSTTIEALQTNKKSNVMEIDTSNRAAKQTAMLIKKILNKYRLQKKYLTGNIDWTEKYKKYLLSREFSMFG